MGRFYAVPFSGAVTTAVDLLEINAAATKVVRVHQIVVSQSSDTDSEQLRVTIQRSTGTSGTGGSAVTPVQLSSGDAAFGGTCEALNTTRATTLTLIENDGFNVLSGWNWLPTPEGRIDIPPSGRLIVGLETTPVDSLTMQGWAIVEEIG